MYANKNLTLTDFVFDITHQGTKSRLIGVVRIAEHSSLQEIFLLRVFLQCHEKVAGIVCLLCYQNTTLIELPTHLATFCARR